MKYVAEITFRDGLRRTVECDTVEWNTCGTTVGLGRVGIDGKDLLTLVGMRDVQLIEIEKQVPQ